MKLNKALLLALLIILIFGFEACKKAEKGCTDPKAKNYNPLATEEDSTCLYGTDTTNNPNNPNVILGCTNPAATNYNPNATQDDGTCIILGCTEPLAENYNPAATQDDGTCIDKREKFAGDWNVDSDCGGGFITLGTPQTFTYNSSNFGDTILIANVIAGATVFGLVSNNNINIPTQTLAGGIPVEINGSGTLSADKTSISVNISYSVDNPFFPISDECTATYTR